MYASGIGQGKSLAFEKKFRAKKRGTKLEERCAMLFLTLIWVPAFAGMTKKRLTGLVLIVNVDLTC